MYILEKYREKITILTRYHNCWIFCIIFTARNHLHHTCKRSITPEQAIVCFWSLLNTKYTCFQRKCNQNARL